MPNERFFADRYEPDASKATRASEPSETIIESTRAEEPAEEPVEAIIERSLASSIAQEATLYGIGKPSYLDPIEGRVSND